MGRKGGSKPFRKPKPRRKPVAVAREEYLAVTPNHLEWPGGGQSVLSSVDASQIKRMLRKGGSK